MAMTCVARLLMGGAVVAPVAGCATKETTAQEDGERLVCTQERSTGSIRPQTTCRTVAQIERERAHAQKDMNSVRQDRGDATGDRLGR